VPERVSPAGEDVVHYAVGPGGTVFVVSGQEHRGFLFDMESGEMQLVQGAVKLGHAVQWHPERARFTVVRQDGKAASIVAIDPKSGALETLVDLPYGDGVLYHAWVAPDVAAWIDGSKVRAVRLDGTVIDVADLSEHGIKHALGLTVDPQRSRIVFERDRTMTWTRFFAEVAQRTRAR
jgi:hypothetical protein